MWVCVYVYIHTYTHTHTHTHTHTGEKNEILPFATIWIELDSIMLSEVSQRKIYDFTHMRNLRYKTDE